MTRFLFWILLIICSPNVVWAEIVLGTGFSSATAGRTSPTLNLGIDYPSFAVTASSVGVKNSYYYHSAYNLIYVRQFDFSEYLWGKLHGGIGAGLHFAKRGLKDGTNAMSEKSDFALGPAIRITWDVAPLCFIGLEAIYGIRDFRVFTLTTQNVRSIIVGVKF